MSDESLGSLSVSLSFCQWRIMVGALAGLVLMKQEIGDPAHAQEEFWWWLRQLGESNGWRT